MKLTTTLRTRAALRRIISEQHGTRKRLRALGRAFEALSLAPAACGMSEADVERLGYSFDPETGGVLFDPQRAAEVNQTETVAELDDGAAEALLGVLEEYERFSPFDLAWVDDVCVQLLGGERK